MQRTLRCKNGRVFNCSRLSFSTRVLPASELMESIRLSKIEQRNLIRKCKDKEGTFDSERNVCFKIAQCKNATHVCSKEVILFEVTLVKDDEINKNVEYNITVTGDVVSLVFLMALFFTYILNKDLQTSYGKCVICLSVHTMQVSLFQVIALHSKHIGPLCKAMAVLLHWDYLAMFVWMAVISTDLYLTFSNLRPIARKLQERRFKSYFCLAESVSALSIVTCVIIDFGPNKSYIGYGLRNACFVASYWANLFAFVVPVGLILTINSFLLSYTLYAIRMRQRKSRTLFSNDSRTRNKRDSGLGFVVMTLKLSTLLGLGWVLAFIGNATNSLWILYLFVVISSFQGLFTFVAFCCNRRVLKFYLSRLRTMRHTRSGTDSMQTVQHRESEF